MRTSTRLALVAVFSALALAACSKKADVPAPAPAAPAAEPAPAPAAEVPPAPAPAAQVAPAPKEINAKAFTIGDLSAFALRDGGIEVPNDNKVFGVGETPAAVAAVLSAAGQPTDKLALNVDPLLVKSGTQVLLFDTGAGSNFGPGAGKLPASLAEAGVDPHSVTDIYISHVHGDHVGGLVNAAGNLAFPDATIHISKPEWAYLTGMNAEAAKMVGLESHDALVAAMTPKVEEFQPGAVLLPGIVKAIPIQGHTPGHSGYLITSRSASLFYVGDAMHHFVISVAKPEWTNNFDGDHAVAAETRTTLIAQLAASKQRVYVVHFPFPNVGTIGKQGDKFVWVGE
jgi:glyoxylase-like metal-dependent hydrolase (beta-lactamase superfamily II)